VDPRLRMNVLYCVWFKSLVTLNLTQVYTMSDIFEILRQIDLAIIYGGDEFSIEMSKLISSLHGFLVNNVGFNKTVVLTPPIVERKVQHPIAYYKDISLSDFKVEYFLPKVPVITRTSTFQGDCFDKWKDFDYIKSIAGFRSVPIEIGTYTSSNMKIEIMTINDFFDLHLDRLDSKHYLAQHPLLDHIPILRKDILEPIYLQAGRGIVNSINAWIGPCGTVSPLHTDQHENLFVQVVGKKYIRLYPPDQTEFLYARDDILSNTSNIVDLESDEFPNLKNAKFVDGIVEPGDLLYIPKGWWHYVESLSISISISYWFD
jgi:hypothetical protein